MKNSQTYHVIAYIFIVLLGALLAAIQYQAYTTQTGDTITIPQIGYFDTPRTLFSLLTLSFMVMLPWILLNIVGTAYESEWLTQTRFWAVLTALFIVFITWIYKGNTYLIPWDISWIYLFVEGTSLFTKSGFMFGGSTLINIDHFDAAISNCVDVLYRRLNLHYQEFQK